MLLDLFFKVAVPLVGIGVVVSKVMIARNKRKGFYEGESGMARRDQINKKYRTNRGAVIIGIACLGIWGLIVAELVNRCGAILFSYVVSALMLIPMFAVYSVLLLIYMGSVHGFANLKARGKVSPK